MSQASIYAMQKWNSAPVARLPVSHAVRRSLGKARRSLGAPTPRSAMQFLGCVLLLVFALYLARHAIEGVLLLFTLKMLAASPSCEAVCAVLMIGFVCFAYLLVGFAHRSALRSVPCCGRRRTLRR